jgi:hypothetical protein
MNIMLLETVEEMFGVKVGDTVKYVANNEKDYPKSLFDKEGQVTRIIPKTGEFHVKIEGVHYEVSFGRTDIVNLSAPEIEEIAFEGRLTETPSMSMGEMKSYLKHYHDFSEYYDFSLVEINGKKEVNLKNEAYAKLVEELFALEKVDAALAESTSKDFKGTMGIEIKDSSVTSRFRASDWTFRTHLAPWTIQSSFFAQFGIDLFKEWGFKNE